MTHGYAGARLWHSLLGCLLLGLCLVPTAWAQQTTGTVSVVVQDASGAVVPGASLTLTDLATNDTRTATTQDSGNYTFVNLTFGQYKLTVSLQGFTTQTLDVLVQSARTTDVKATLKVGGMTDVVQVSADVTPLVETSSNAINTTIDMKQIEDLPLGGRNISQLSQLTAGYNGTWNGLPSAAQGNTVDGIIGNTTRWRYQTLDSARSTAITPRLENIAEMVVSADQIDMNQGFGNSGMQITYVTRRGSNAFHGRLFEDFRSQILNANNWNSTVKPTYHQNEFGASLGGPVVPNKLFFFASGSALDVPGSSRTTRTYLTDPAKLGVFAYGNGVRANLFDIFARYNTANGTAFPAAASQINAMVQARLAQVDQYRQNSGVMSAPALQPTDPNLRQWEWQYTNPQRTYYPTFRTDYNISDRWRLNLAYNQSKFNAPSAISDHWPGDGRGAANKSNNASVALGLDTTISPTLVNEFKGGWLYTAAWFGIGGSDGFYTSPIIQYGYGNYDDNYELPNSRMQPIFSVSDNMTWVKGSHTLRFGGNAYREVNKYWDPPEGYTLMSLGLIEGDPARDVLTKEAMQAAAGPGAPLPTDAEWAAARQLYATLTGRISNFWGRHAYLPATGTYAAGSTPNGSGVAYSTLNELLKSWGLFAQDSYRMKPNFTVNMGLRWDFISPDQDLTGKYHSLTPQDLFGPTAVGDLFNPGGQSLTGTFDPVYSARQAAYGHWNVTPQPAAGIAWTPRSDGNFIERLLGGDKSAIRAGYSFRRFTMPQQFVWDMGSSFGLAFYQNFGSSPSTSGDLGTFMPGSVTLGSSGWLPQSCATTGSRPPCLVYSPQQYDQNIHMKDATFVAPGAAAAIDSNIRQPYVQSWTLGVQRELGRGRALEVRYNGNITRHQWLAKDINEVNIFENGFLNEFKNAQANLSINQTAGVTSFANRGLPGQANLPIMSAAGISFTNATFINQLRNGQAGSFANTLATTRDYFCRMVGTTFSPCGSSYGAGAGYPINFWMANPFAIGSWTGASYMSDDGYSNYNGLQVEFRQRQWHGATMTANYTLSKTMGVSTAGDWTGSYTQFTIRDLSSSYAPASTDRTHVVHVNATYDLPFGNGRRWLQNGVLDKVAGGWTVSTIVTFQSGTPFRITGNNNTFNNKRDGGIVLNGITPQDIQDKVGLYFNSAGQPYFLPPDWVAQIKADGTITSNTVPGTWGDIFYLHGPHQTFTDLGISKSVPITGQVRFKFQMEMLNAFNHPVFDQSTVALANTAFGRGRLMPGTSSRRIELRGNIEF